MRKTDPLKALRALGDSSRQRIFELLGMRPMAVIDITKGLSISRLQSCEGTGRRHHLTGIEPVHLTPDMCSS